MKNKKGKIVKRKKKGKYVGSFFLRKVWKKEKSTSHIYLFLYLWKIRFIHFYFYLLYLWKIRFKKKYFSLYFPSLKIFKTKYSWEFGLFFWVILWCYYVGAFLFVNGNVWVHWDCFCVSYYFIFGVFELFSDFCGFTSHFSHNSKLFVLT